MTKNSTPGNARSTFCRSDTKLVGESSISFSEKAQIINFTNLSGSKITILFSDICPRLIEHKRHKSEEISNDENMAAHSIN